MHRILARNGIMKLKGWERCESKNHAMKTSRGSNGKSEGARQVRS